MKNYLKILVAGMFLLPSCKKHSQMGEKDHVVDYAKGIIEVEMVSNELEFIGRYLPVDIVKYPDDGHYLGKGKIARKGIVTGQKIEIDFGAGGICTDGKFRSGKLTIEFNETNFDTMLKPLSYKVGDTEIDGNYSIGYIGGSGRKNLQLTILNGKLLREGHDLANFVLSRKSRYESGWETPEDINDDVIVRSELAYDLMLEGKDGRFLVKARSIGDSKLAYSCANPYYPTTGQLKVEVVASQPSNFSLVFGNGSCNSTPVID